MKKVLTLVLVFSLVLLGISSNSYAFGYLNEGNGNMDCVVEDSLDLTTAQEEEITTLREEFDNDREALQEEIREYNRSREDQEKIDELRNELDNLRKDYIAKLENILTEEQLSEIELNPKENSYEGSQGKNNKGQGNGRGNSTNKGRGSQGKGRNS